MSTVCCGQCVLKKLKSLGAYLWLPGNISARVLELDEMEEISVSTSYVLPIVAHCFLRVPLTFVVLPLFTTISFWKNL